MDSIASQLILQVVLIAFNAIFACIEIAVISFNDNKLDKLATNGNKNAQRLSTLMDQPAKFLATIQVSITLSGFLASAFAADNFSTHLSSLLSNIGVPFSQDVLRTMSVVIITLILSYITLVFGELVPKRIAMKKSESIALFLANFIFYTSKLFSPIVWFLTISTNAILKLFGIDPNDEDEEVTEEEIRMMIDVGTEKGTIDLDEKEFIHNVFEFDNIEACELMTHRTHVTMLWLEESDDKWYETIRNTNFSYYPICEETFDNVKGILTTKEYFRLPNKDRQIVFEKAVIDPLFIPETVKADKILSEMKKQRKHIAIVLDEYAGMSGIVTMHDLLEELVGDLEDYDDEIELDPIVEIAEDTYRIDGKVPLSEVAQRLNINLPIDEFDTFGGMVFGILGAIPTDGSKPKIDAYDLHIKVEEIRRHRMVTALVSKIPKV